MKLTGRARPGQGGWLQGGPDTNLPPSLTHHHSGRIIARSQKAQGFFNGFHMLKGPGDGAG